MTTQEEDNAPWRTVDNYDPDEAWAVIGPEQEFIVDTERGVIADSMAAARGTQGDLPVACWVREPFVGQEDEARQFELICVCVCVLVLDSASGRVACQT